MWYFYRSSGGLEVDLIEERATETWAYEIKSGETFRPQQLHRLNTWCELARVDRTNATLLYAGTETFIHEGVTIRPWWTTPEAG